MRKIVFLLITLIGFSAFAQKSEVKLAEKAMKKGDLETAKTMVNKACKLKADADEKTKERILFTKAKIYKELGGKDVKNYETSVAVLEKLEKFEKETGRKKYADDAAKLKQEMMKELSKFAFDKYNGKMYKSAGLAFELVSKLADNEYYDYSAAVSYLLGEDYDKSLGLLQSLYKSGFTGVREIVTAKNKETGKRDEFTDEKTAKISEMAGTHEDVKKEKTKNLRPDVIANILFVYGKMGKDDEAIKFIEEAKKEEPNNLDLIIGEGNYYLKKGNNEKFAEAMKKAVAVDPNNKLYNFNLATALYQLKKYDEAKKYYEKTVEIDPNYVDAYKGIAYVILAPEKKITDELNKDEVLMNDALYNKYNNQRLDLYRKVLPTVEKAYSVAPNDESVLIMLKKIYNDLEMKTKYKEVKAKLKALQGK